MSAPAPNIGISATSSNYHLTLESSIAEVKEWLSFKSLESYLPILLANGYDDLDSIAQIDAQELPFLVNLFPNEPSQNSLRLLVETLRDLGIVVYRKQKKEFRALCADHDASQKKQEVIAAEVSRVRGQSQAVHKPSVSVSSGGSQNGPSVNSPSSSTANGGVAATSVPPSPASTTSTASTSTTTTAGTPATAASATSIPPSPASKLKLPPPISAAAIAAAPPVMINPTAAFNVDTWEGSIQFQAYLHSIQSYARAFDEPILPPAQLESKLLDGRSNLHLIKIKRFLQALVNGCIFKKFKRGSSSKRMIWTSSNFDFVLWGVEDKSLIKGYINTHEIQEINQGFAIKNKNRLYIVSPERTLELEAKDGLQAQEWKEMLEFLIQLNIAHLEQKKLLQTGPGAAAFNSKFKKTKQEYTKLISTGSVFKKWPGMGHMGSFTTRLIWSPPVVDRLQWGDLTTRKVMGFILIQDIVELKENEQDKSKFVLFAMERSLPLEARNEQTRDRWVKALRFFIEFKQQAMGK